MRAGAAQGPSDASEGNGQNRLFSASRSRSPAPAGSVDGVPTSASSPRAQWAEGGSEAPARYTNSELTESEWWMRRMASAKRRATETTLNLPLAAAFSVSGMVFVTTTSVSSESLMR